ncbi:MAG: PRC-barrel domain-containing protein [Xanthobacteraceae bacterium]|nr:PRC-barrel domain-containing protein [Xanthobacteraceae bacterium]
MLKKLMLTTALTGLAIGAAVAEGTPPAPDSPSPPAAQSSPPAMPPAKSPEMTSPAPSSSTAERSGVTAPRFVNSQRSDQFLASKFRGIDVVGNDNEKIGDVSDILFDKDGNIQAYVIGVGGFLGIGAKDVALAPAAFQVVPGDKSKNESDKLKLGMTKDELKQASTFEPYKAPSATTGMGGGAGSRPAAPAGGGMAR